LRHLAAQYGSVVVVTLVVAVLMAFVTPFGNYLGDSIVAMVGGSGETLDYISNEGFKEQEAYYNEMFNSSSSKYKQAGLYVDGKLNKTWSELCSQKFLIVKVNEDDIRTLSTINDTTTNPITNNSSDVLNGDLVVKSDVSIIDINAFAGCTKLNSITLKDISEIGNHAFFKCNNLTMLILDDNSLKNVGESAFDGCSNLKTIYFKGTYDEFKQIAFQQQNITQTIQVVCSDKTVNIVFPAAS
jgi:hypothetical protein